MRMKLLVVALAGAGLFSTGAQAQTEIQWWHSMGGALGQALNGLATKFNESQKDYKVVTTYKGSYPESLTAAIAALVAMGLTQERQRLSAAPAGNLCWTRKM